MSLDGVDVDVELDHEFLLHFYETAAGGLME